MTHHSPSNTLHKFADVHPDARLGENVTVGPFCVVGPEVSLGDGCTLDSNVVLTGRVEAGENNRFWPGCVIGAEPQDKSFDPNGEMPLGVQIGHDNQFREGVTVHRGAPKEDGLTRIGSRNLLMANCHVAHNCHVRDDTHLVNGVLLGGHVHVHDRAIISGNSVVHHFSTIGTLAFVSGGCRVPHDVPPYMLSAGSDNPQVRTINAVGMQRAGIARETIRLVKDAYKLLYREMKTADAVRDHFAEHFAKTGRGDILPLELMTLMRFLDAQKTGRMGRGREGARTTAQEAKKAA